MASHSKRALVIGGSVGGLFAGGLLRQAGWDVTVFERSMGDLSGRGAGLGITQELIDIMTGMGVPFDPSIGIPYYTYQWRDLTGAMRHECPRPAVASVWAGIYRPLRDAFPDANYRDGMSLARVEQDADGVIAIFEDGSRETGDLLVAADGSLSSVRAQLLPEVAPSYAGYVAWRGLVAESALPVSTREAVSGHIVFSFSATEIALSMLVPGTGDDVREGHRRYYFIWYRPVDPQRGRRDLFTDEDGRDHGISIPPPLIRNALTQEVKSSAGDFFAPVVAAIVRETPQLLLQAISDLASPNLAFGRIAIMGDAAFIARPHVAGGTTKAALDAKCLVDALDDTKGDVPAAIAAYDLKQRKFGNDIVAHSRFLGSYIERQDGLPQPTPEQIMAGWGAPHLLHNADLVAFS